jgi:hypothetical protein
MKNLIAIILFSAITVLSYGQKTTPRFGTAVTASNTFQSLTVGYCTGCIVTDTGGSTPDTLLITPSIGNRGGLFENYVDVTLTDSAVLSIKSVGSCYKGDRMTLTINNTAGSNHNLKLLGYSALATKWGVQASGGTKISLATGATTTMQFVFNGVNWQELCRSTNN